MGGTWISLVDHRCPMIPQACQGSQRGQGKIFILFLKVFFQLMVYFKFGQKRRAVYHSSFQDPVSQDTVITCQVHSHITVFCPSSISNPHHEKMNRSHTHTFQSYGLHLSGISHNIIYHMEYHISHGRFRLTSSTMHWGVSMFCFHCSP